MNEQIGRLVQGKTKKQSRERERESWNLSKGNTNYLNTFHNVEAYLD